VDETPINYLDPGNGKTRQGYLWTGNRPGGDVFFHWADWAQLSGPLMC
jgi:hypothetical protein